MYRHRNKLEIESRINKARSVFFLLALLACCGMCVSEHLFMLPFAKHSPRNFFKTKSHKFSFSRSLHTTNDTFSGRNDFSSFFPASMKCKKSLQLFFAFPILTAGDSTNERELTRVARKIPLFSFSHPRVENSQAYAGVGVWGFQLFFFLADALEREPGGVWGRRRCNATRVCITKLQPPCSRPHQHDRSQQFSSLSTRRSLAVFILFSRPTSSCTVIA